MAHPSQPLIAHPVGVTACSDTSDTGIGPVPVPRTAKSILVVTAVIAVMAIAARLLLRENVHDLLETLRDLDPMLIGLAIAAYFASVFVWSLRWRIALSCLDCHVSIGTLASIILSGIFLNNVTPVMRVGGDPFGRVYLLQKLAHTRYSSSMATSIGEHAFDPLFTVLLLTGGLFLQSVDSSPWLAATVLAVGGAVTITVGFGPRLFFKQKVGLRGVGHLLGRISGWVWRRTDNQRIVQGVETFYSGVYTVINTWRRGFLIGGLTAVIWVLDVLRFYVIFLSLGHQPTLGMLLLASSLPVLLGLIPFLPGGLVIVEGSLVALFAAHGVPIEIAVAVTMIERGISFVLSSIVGGVFFSYLGIKSAGNTGPQE